ncbi:hypothetical protein ACL02T_16940 [Pseudonocardia sp. RS010]|uniref:hypothetical protein n=1 Tax=Pseudonocardia sp. RS010 TaxID=3385979 RepID=UPI0039A298D9
MTVRLWTRRRRVPAHWAGLAAGAAGTTALNAVTYLDMALFARPSSTTPEDTVRKAEDLAGVSLSREGSDSEQAGNRRSGIGALLGIAAGLGTGAAYALAHPALRRLSLPVRGLAAGLAANVGSTAPMTVLGVTDPRRWPASSWVQDLIPHLTYGLVTAAVYEALRG